MKKTVFISLILIFSCLCFGIYNIGVDYAKITYSVVNHDRNEIIIKATRDTTRNEYFAVNGLGKPTQEREITEYHIIYTTYTITKYIEYLEEKSEWKKDLKSK